MIPANYFDDTRRRESDGILFAKNPRSSATGLYQFTDGTWGDMMQKHPELNLTPDGRVDADQQDRAMKAFTADNASTLTSAGQPVNRDTLYLAHRFGAGGALKALSADPSSLVSDIFPEVMKANPDLQGKRIVDITSGAGTSSGGMHGPISAAFQSTGAQMRPAEEPGLFDRVHQGGLGALIGAPNGVFTQDNGQPGYDLGHALQGAGAALASIGSPQQGAALASLSVRQNKTAPEFITTYDAKSGSIIRTNKRTGQVTVTRNPNALPEEDPASVEGRKEYAKEDAKRFAKMDNDIYTSAGEAQHQIATLDQLKTLLSNPSVYQGAFGDYAQFARKIASSVGLPVEGIADADLVQSIGNSLVLQARKLNGGMPGALSDKDLMFLKQMSVSLNNSPGANAQIVENLKSVHQRALDVENLRQKYVAEHGHLDRGFQKIVMDYANAHPLFEAQSNAPSATTPDRPPLSSIFK